MRLLASTDYAIRMLMLLAQQSQGRHLGTDSIAQSLGGLSRNHIQKIVQELTALGVTRTIRGPGGGVALALRPDEIRLGTLIQRLESEHSMVECVRPEAGSCTMMSACRLPGILLRAQRDFYVGLDRYSLKDCLIAGAPVQADPRDGGPPHLPSHAVNAPDAG